MANFQETDFQGETGKTILVYGLGRSGKAVCRLLAAQGCAFAVVDERVIKDPEAARDDIAFVKDLGGTLLGRLEHSEQTFSYCIAAPGVPWQHRDLVTLRAGGTETIGEVEWVYRTLVVPAKQAGHGVTLIGITGTAGKTSTTHWTHTLLAQAGKRTLTGGNTGTALADVVVEAGFVANPAELDGVTLVTELSSFQLERCPELRPDIAIILNLGVDHLDRHGTVRDYHLAKKNLLNNLTAQDTFIYNADDPKLAAWAKETPAKALGFSSALPHPVSHMDMPTPATNISPADIPVTDTSVTDTSVTDTLSTEAVTLNRYPAYQYKETLWLEQQPLIDTRELRVQGNHQHHNALAVALAGHACGLEKDTIKEGLRAFAGVPGRYAQVAEIAGVRFVEDSIATRTLAVKAALEATPAPIVWLVGGQDKGAETDSLRALVRDKVRLLIGIGEAGRMFAEVFAEVTRVRVCEEAAGERALAQACQWGLEALGEMARETPTETPTEIPTEIPNTPNTLGTILLAPLAASFDQFVDYQARAQAFRRVVAALVQSKQAQSKQAGLEQAQSKQAGLEQAQSEQNETQPEGASWTVS